MKWTMISDLHVENPYDEAYSLLIKFLRHPLTRSSEKVFLLGDIFDVMVGEYEIYRQEYDLYFKELSRLIADGVEVHYFEGNHDFHLKGLYTHLGVIFHQAPWWEIIDGKHYCLGHGDGYAKRERGYRVYKKLMMSPLIKSLLKIVPYGVVNWIGRKSSRGSKGYRKGYDFTKGHWKELFREDIKGWVESQNDMGVVIDVIICGHYHLQDAFPIVTTKGKEVLYLNGGYPLKEKTFLYIENHHYSFVTFGDKT